MNLEITEAEIKILDDARAAFGGEDAGCRIIIEECSEAIKVLIKRERIKAGELDETALNNRMAIQEELADLMVVLAQGMRMFGAGVIEEHAQRKVDRLAQRVAEAKERKDNS